ncbi:uncharacterized protein K02A2.6-like [Planococcus citri]|uniref:uncharacterized protein K02A2.6-like n=1 Tax=Planococcus citri TaxID=170843 RepID=UPI0031F97EDE
MDAQTAAAILQSLTEQSKALTNAVARLAESSVTTSDVLNTTTSGGSNSSAPIVRLDKYDEQNESFENFISRLEVYFNAYHTATDKKASTLLNSLSPKMFALVKNLVYPEDIKTASYATLKKLIEDKVCPKRLKILARHAFLNRKQREGESVSDYITELRKLAVDCKYANEFLNEMLRDVFVSGLRSKPILDRLFEEDDIPLDKTLSIAQAIERALASTNEILSPAVSDAPVHKLQNQNQNRSRFKKKTYSCDNGGQFQSATTTQCIRCGLNNHTAANCMKKNLRCNFCKAQGHVAEVCFKKKRAAETKPANESTSTKTNSNAKPKGVKSVSKYNDVSDDDDYNVLTLPVRTVHSCSVQDDESPVMINVKINDNPTEMEVDCGSLRSIMSKSIFCSLGGNLSTLQPTNDVFKDYTGHVFHPIGVARVPVKYNDKSTKLTLHIINENLPALLGRDGMRELEIYLSNIHSVQRSDLPTPVAQRLEALLEKYSCVFEPTIGEIKDHVESLHFKPDAEPKFLKARPVPIALRSKIEDELDRLVANGVLKKVETSEWASPIVPVVKKNAVRITGDYSGTVNPQIFINQYPFPGYDEITTQMSNEEGSEVHSSVLDVYSAFLHMPTDEKTSDALVINTHRGLYRPKRIFFSVGSAPAKFQKWMDGKFRRKGRVVVHDDIHLSAASIEEHFRLLEDTLRICKEANLRLNRSKCRFFERKVKFVGYTIDANGVHETDDKVLAVLNVPAPTNPTEVKSFLGLVGFYSKFVPHLATIAAPLHRLTRQSEDFIWTDECEQSFQHVKQEIASERVLTRYDPKKPIVAIKWAVTKFFNYLYGQRFVLYTDSEPLTHIFGPHRKKLPALSATRMMHYALYLQQFVFDIKYRRSEKNGNADALSRLPLPTSSDDLFASKDDIAVFHVSQMDKLPVTKRELAKATVKDPETRSILDGLRAGKIYNSPYTCEGDVLFMGMRVYVPSALRSSVLQELHKGHIGASKMKSLARSHLYWPKIDKDIENITKKCQSCVENASDPKKTSHYSWEPASAPMERVHIDFATINGKILFLIVDAFSKWVEVDIVPSTSSKSAISSLESFFTTFGIAQTVVSDNGTAFTSSEFKEFAENVGFCHKTSAPFHPATNGQVERFVATVKNSLKRLPGTDLQQKLNEALFAIRRAPHTTTGISPAKRFLGRELNSPLNLSAVAKAKSKPTPISRPPVSFSEGERVAARNYSRHQGKKWLIGKIVSKDGEVNYTVSVNDSLHRFHVDQLRKIDQNISPTGIVPIFFPAEQSESPEPPQDPGESPVPQ